MALVTRRTATGAADVVFDKMSLPVLEFLVGPWKKLAYAELLLASLTHKAKKELADGDGEDQHKAALLLANLEGSTRVTIDDEVIRTARARLNILEKRASLGLADLAMPSDFKCPISLELMTDPVTLVGDGMTYERASIERWLAAGNTTSPVTNAELSSLAYGPNQFAKNMIRAWREGEGAELVRAAQ